MIKKFIPFKVKEYIKLKKYDDIYKDTEKIFKKKNRDCGIILLGQPIHGNMGDHAIIEAELNYFKDNISEKIYLFSMPYIHVHFKILKKYIKKNDIIVISGGGWLGNLWLTNEIVVQKIINTFPENNIIIFPQTVYYTNQNNSLYKNAKITYPNHQKLSVFLREKNSYDYFLENFSYTKDNIYLVPDIVLYLNKTSMQKRDNEILFCLRQDIEKVIDDKIILELSNYLKSKSFNIRYTDTVLKKHNIKISKRDEILNKKIAEFQKAKLVITDRLHGMLFSVITGTPCIVFDNRTKKVAGVYQWLKDSHQILYIDNPKEINFKQISSFINQQFDYSFDNSLIKDKYNLITKIINKINKENNDGKN